MSLANIWTSLEVNLSQQSIWWALSPSQPWIAPKQRTQLPTSRFLTHRNGEMKSVVLSLYIHGHWLHEYTHQRSGNALGFLQLHPSPVLVSWCLSMAHSPEVGKARCHLTNRTCTCLLCGTVVKNLPKANMETNEPKDFLLKSEITRPLNSTSLHFKALCIWKCSKYGIVFTKFTKLVTNVTWNSPISRL